MISQFLIYSLLLNFVRKVPSIDLLSLDQSLLIETFNLDYFSIQLIQIKNSMVLKGKEKSRQLNLTFDYLFTDLEIK